jgi:hypothetical protein
MTDKLDLARLQVYDAICFESKRVSRYTLRFDAYDYVYGLLTLTVNAQEAAETKYGRLDRKF